MQPANAQVMQLGGGGGGDCSRVFGDCRPGIATMDFHRSARHLYIRSCTALLIIVLIRDCQGQERDMLLIKYVVLEFCSQGQFRPIC